MNRLIGIFLVFIASNVFAQASNVAINKGATGGDLVEFVNAEQMPLPIPKGELEKLKKTAFSPKSVDGFSPIEKSPEEVSGFFLQLNAAKAQLANQSQRNAQVQRGAPQGPEVHKDLSTLKLAFKAASFGRGTLIAATSAGTIIDAGWTGVERFFRVEGEGVTRVTEYDLGATKGKFYMLKDAVNTRVNGKSAISKIFTDDDGQTIEEIVWVDGNKFYMLAFSPDVVAGNAAGTKSKIAPHV
jgi:hypothetical protein